MDTTVALGTVTPRDSAPLHQPLLGIGTGCLSLPHPQAGIGHLQLLECQLRVSSVSLSQSPAQFYSTAASETYN